MLLGLDYRISEFAEVAKCPLSDHDTVLRYFNGAVWGYLEPLQTLLGSVGSPRAAVGSLVLQAASQQRGVAPLAAAGWSGQLLGLLRGKRGAHCAACVKHQGTAWGHDWATSSKVHPSFSSGICCGSRALLLCRAHTRTFSFQPQPITG